MTTHPLDNPIWKALTTKQAGFSETSKLARRFPPEVTLLGAMDVPTCEAYESMGGLLKADEACALFLHEVARLPSSLSLAMEEVPLSQMVCEEFARPVGQAAATAAPEIEEMGQQDVAEMVALAELTKPGPFGPRTRELGTYLGIRQDGRLAAMAGERLQFAGHTEVSAVCTHPDFLGRGYAAALMSALVERIIARNETAFLHVRSANPRAIELYKRLGFRERLVFQLAVVRKA
jgi:predicted GNAT family acetyltransferase